MKISVPRKKIVGHLKENSIENKFDALTFTIDPNTDKLLIWDTKLDY